MKYLGVYDVLVIREIQFEVIALGNSLKWRIRYQLHNRMIVKRDIALRSTILKILIFMYTFFISLFN